MTRKAKPTPAARSERKLAQKMRVLSDWLICWVEVMSFFRFKGSTGSMEVWQVFGCGRGSGVGVLGELSKKSFENA